MKKRFGWVGVLTLWLAGAGAAQATPEFSATMVQNAPDQEPMTSKLYVSGDAMREETTVQGQTRIRIHDKSSNTMWLLNPDKKEYVEFSAGQAQAQGAPDGEPPLPDEPNSPCQQAASGLTCTKLGVEEVNGRSAVKWRFTASRDQQQAQWTEWFDQDLRIPIRGEGPQGMVRELQDIQVGPQPDHLFEVPADYTRIEMPRGQGRR